MVETAERVLMIVKQWRESLMAPDRGNNQGALSIPPELHRSPMTLNRQAAAVPGTAQGQRDWLADLVPQWHDNIGAWGALIENEVADDARRGGPAIVVPGGY